MKTVFLIAFILMLSGCLTLPVNGQYKEGGEKFLGSATGYMSGTGDIAITSATGTKCEGSFRYINLAVNGDGAFTCSDGRVGDFFFTSNGHKGEGFGRDNQGKLFSFSFGGDEYAPNWAAVAAAFDSMSRMYRPTTSYCTQYGFSFRCTHY